MSYDRLPAERATASRLIPLRIPARELGLPFGKLVLMARRGEFPEIFEIAENHFVVVASEYAAWKHSRMRVVAGRTGSEVAPAMEGATHG